MHHETASEGTTEKNYSARPSATEEEGGEPDRGEADRPGSTDSPLRGPRGFAGTPPRPRFFVASRDKVLLRQQARSTHGEG